MIDADQGSTNEYSLLVAECIGNPRLQDSGITGLSLGELVRYEGRHPIPAPVYLRDGLAASQFLAKQSAGASWGKLSSYKSVADVIRAAYANGWYSPVTLKKPEDALKLPVGLLYTDRRYGGQNHAFNDAAVLQAAQLLIELDQANDLSCQAQVIERVWSIGDPDRFSHLLPKYSMQV